MPAKLNRRDITLTQFSEGANIKQVQHLGLHGDGMGTMQPWLFISTCICKQIHHFLGGKYHRFFKATQKTEEKISS